ncbi:MAG: aminopeptidase [Halobacteriales archaeon]
MDRDDRLREAAETAVDTCLALEPTESCAIVTDDERLAIGTALYEAAASVTDDSVLVRYPPGGQHGEEPPAPVAAALEVADAFLAPTTMSLSHTRARGAATEAGARGATLPGITEAVFRTGLDADYGSIARTCRDLADRLAGSRTLRIETDAGTDLAVEPGDRPWLTDTGLVRDPGDFSNLPAGEVFVAPERATGTVVVDGTMMPHGLLEVGHTVRFEVEGGVVTAIDDPEVRAQVATAAEAVGDDAFNLAELGIGANLGVTELVGSVLLDEKAAGTVHVAIGDDAGIGGDTEAPIHLDGVLRDPRVTVDGESLALPGA